MQLYQFVWYNWHSLILFYFVVESFWTNILQFYCKRPYKKIKCPCECRKYNQQLFFQEIRDWGLKVHDLALISFRKDIDKLGGLLWSQRGKLHPAPRGFLSKVGPTGSNSHQFAQHWFFFLFFSFQRGNKNSTWTPKSLFKASFWSMQLLSTTSQKHSFQNANGKTSNWCKGDLSEYVASTLWSSMIHVRLNGNFNIMDEIHDFVSQVASGDFTYASWVKITFYIEYENSI